MARAGDNVKRDILGGAGGGKGGDKARPLISLEQDDPARSFGGGEKWLTEHRRILVSQI